MAPNELAALSQEGAGGYSDGIFQSLDILARALHVKDAELEPALQAIVSTAVGTVSAAQYAGLILVSRGALVPQAATGLPPQQSKGGHRAALRASRIDIVTALGVAGLINMAMMTVAAAVLHGSDASSLADIHAGLDETLSSGAAAAFALALLASGLASSSVGIYAGQVIMEGFLRRRMPLAARRLVTIGPAIIILAVGIDPVRLLLLSQVALTAGLPFALIPLTMMTSSKKVMGSLANRPVTTAAAVGTTLAIVALNAALLIQAVTG